MAWGREITQPAAGDRFRFLDVLANEEREATTEGILGGVLQGGGVLIGSATWDASSIADGDKESKDITVTGAALGDMVIGVSIGVDTVDLALVAAVTAANTATATLLNNTGSAVDLASTTVRVAVLPKGLVGF